MAIINAIKSLITKCFKGTAVVKPQNTSQDPNNKLRRPNSEENFTDVQANYERYANRWRQP